MQMGELNIEWLGHDGFKINATNKKIYIDPYQLKTSFQDADVICITHEHYDHCSPEDIERVIKPASIIITIPECQSKLSKIVARVADVLVMEPFQKEEREGYIVETIPAYNTNKFRSPGLPFHPEEDGKVGFILTMNGKRIYHAGDTDFIPEMKSLKNIDIALIPVSGTYVMTPEEAAQAVESFKPKIAIPMHYNSIVGTVKDAEKFKSLVKSSQVFILEKANL
ncbi:MAG: MBL fold metallo-hydrolase [Nanoarchaeota archaeon]